MTTHWAHITQWHAEVVIEEWIRLGLRHLCIAPGSRSSPLVLAAQSVLAEQAAPALQLHVHFDERGLGFYALGLAKAYKAPVAVLTTSGSAVANLVPAAVEAWQTREPVLWVSADRPTELHHCGANQTLAQAPLLGPWVVAQHLQQAAEPSTHWPQVLQQLDDLWTALSEGPAHLNIAFREPLYPTQGAIEGSGFTPPPNMNEWLHDDQPYHALTTQARPDPSHPDHATPTAAEWQVFCQGQGVIIAGALQPHEARQLQRFQAMLGWPLLTEIQSQCHGHPDTWPADRSLRDANIRSALNSADRILWLGDHLTSKPLMQWLASRTETDKQVECWQVCSRPGRRDAGFPVKRAFTADVAEWLNTRPHPVEAKAWNLPPLPELTIPASTTANSTSIREVAFFHLLGHWLPDQALLFLGNSLPIRLMDSLGHARSVAEVFTNRGVSGIDGILATACGVAAARQQPLTLVLGDQSLLHDLNSMALAGSLTQPFVVIVINNGGGNIFDIMPIDSAEVKSRYFMAAHENDFAHAAAQFGWQYQAPQDLASGQAAYQTALTQPGPTLLEVKTTRGQAVSDWRACFSHTDTPSQSTT
ncbi:2-succinyl-5-enolpyruvyl-6-hydroxy-3-cyclohexene-1-carboxylic-acid synthase [Terasakiispira papahanaumokuakeensis]|nr:2-succinyl-5-enolpyruvyl-6-hydroxy-3-cyclohexene-1-carboxylic-acid synthase [Terasakiispira papahanaumokuakeensis]